MKGTCMIAEKQQETMVSCQECGDAESLCRRWTLVFGGTVFALVVLLIALVVFVDPFFHYHAPLEGYPYLIDNQLSQNPGMAEHMEYDSVLLGSSMTVNFEADWFSELMGLDLIKLPYNGAYPRDIYNIMECVDKSGQPLQAVFWGVDLASYTGSVEETKYPLPEYLYDDIAFNDWEYWLNKQVLLDYILKPLFSGDGATDLSSVYNSHWWMVNFYGKETVLDSYKRPEELAEVQINKTAYTQALLANLETNIAPLLENHPDTKFVIFYPPYSILFWYDYLAAGQLDAVLEEYRVSMEWFLGYDNVEVYYFQNMPEVITNLDNYADISHHNQKINRYMAECFTNGTYQVGPGEYEAVLEDMRNLIEGYDYHSLWEAE